MSISKKDTERNNPGNSRAKVVMATAVAISDDDFIDADDYKDDDGENYPKHSQHSKEYSKSKSGKQHKNSDDNEIGNTKFSSSSSSTKNDSSSSKPYVKHKDVSFSTAKNDVQLKVWPTALRQQIIQSFSRLHDEETAKQFLDQHDWPVGLQQTVFKSMRKIAMRFFIVDDSGSMILNDGKRIVKTGQQSKLVRCTRWSELSESLQFLADLSDALKVPSEFRLLNGADPVIVGLGEDPDGESMTFLREALAESPAGPTPLCTHIQAVAAAVTSIADELRANQQKAAVIIATDGESSDGNVADALRPLTNLPVLVILRLCTEEQAVVDYWDSIDNQLELDIDVLDDQMGDARQIQAVNNWLTYGEPIHRMREFGASMKELDIIDESTLSSEQMRVMCAYLFLNGNPKDLPHPGVDWGAFRSKIRELNSTQPKVFCTLTNSMKPWVDMKNLDRCYGSENHSPHSKSCSVM